jgi:hypothetical protein
VVLVVLVLVVVLVVVVGVVVVVVMLGVVVVYMHICVLKQAMHTAPKLAHKPCVCLYVAAGNHAAAAYVYDTRTGCQVTRVEAIRVQGHVKACGLSEDCR